MRVHPVPRLRIGNATSNAVLCYNAASTGVHTPKCECGQLDSPAHRVLDFDALDRNAARDRLQRVDPNPSFDRRVLLGLYGHDGVKPADVSEVVAVFRDFLVDTKVHELFLWKPP